MSADGFPDDPKAADIEHGLARLGEGLMRRFEPDAPDDSAQVDIEEAMAAEHEALLDLLSTLGLSPTDVLPPGVPCPPLAEVYVNGRWGRPPFEEPMNRAVPMRPHSYRLPAPPVELYDQDARVFSGHTSEPGRTLRDVPADSPEGQALIDELNGDVPL